MQISLIIIGDELMSGKYQDKHFSHMQSALAKRGLEVSSSMTIGDDADQLTHFLNYSFSTDHLVFSFGGIGATPDDRTRQCVANVANVDLYPHPEAVAEIEAQFGELAYPNRILMGHLPIGSRIIPNTVNRVPGFSFNDHHFMPGFPEMAWPMVDWVLDNHYPDLHDLSPQDEQIIFVPNARESDLLSVMNRIVEDYPDLKLSSLPHLAETPYIELSLRGNSDEIDDAMTVLKIAITNQQLTWSTQWDKK